MPQKQPMRVLVHAGPSVAVMAMTPPPPASMPIADGIRRDAEPDEDTGNLKDIMNDAKGG